MQGCVDVASALKDSTSAVVKITAKDGTVTVIPVAVQFDEVDGGPGGAAHALSDVVNCPF
eukprot:COSAG01_NODE_46356_length_400_cov_16.694352_2_plen_60_part_00